MTADARREPLPDAGHGPGRPPDGPPEEEPWGFARGFRSLFKWPQENAAPALPPLTASGLRAQREDGHREGGVHRPAAPSPGAISSNVVAQHPVPDAAQEGGLETPEPAPLRSGAGRPPTGPAEGPGDGVAGSQSRQDAEPRQGPAAVPEDPASGSSSSLTPVACVAVSDPSYAGPNSRGVTGPRGTAAWLLEHGWRSVWGMRGSIHYNIFLPASPARVAGRASGEL